MPGTMITTMPEPNQQKLRRRLNLEWLRLSIRSVRWPGDDLFLLAAYRTYLKRDPDEAGLRHYNRHMKLKTMSRSSVVQSMVRSMEFRTLHGLPIHYQDALHLARVILVKYFLPPAEMILDLGGALGDSPQGTLLAMGYSHSPREITIIDLPPEERFDPAGTGVRAAPASPPELVTADGVAIRGLHRSMVDLSPIPDASIDLVWSGESIEHVTEEDADVVCREVFRVLRTGGHFCLDTPNAALTRLQCPDELIHPEHKMEYRVADLRAKLERCGFSILEAKAICPMPESLRTGLFDSDEIIRNVYITDNVEEGYLFYLKAVKPTAGA
ncbi:MAG: methyltransferase domain-containing protein [Dehalococcoidia bacterium]|nr:methyltransferase domain-containing protein [Dehalococcoidia bacterium]